MYLLCPIHGSFYRQKLWLGPQVYLDAISTDQHYRCEPKNIQEYTGVYKSILKYNYLSKSTL